jgi:hypothetical protein
MKRSSLVLVYIIGLLVIIFAYLQFAVGFSFWHLILYISVTAFLYSMWLFEPFFPWIDDKDSSQKTIASLGIKWFTLGIYTFLAILFLIYALISNNPLSLIGQLIIHAGMIFLFLFGFINARVSERVTQRNHEKQTKTRKGISEIGSQLRIVIERLQAGPNPSFDVIESLKKMQEEIRFITPNETVYSQELEGRIVGLIQEIETQTRVLQVDWSFVSSNCTQCLQLLQERKRNAY